MMDGIDADVYARAEATESRFVSRAPGRDILHLATHGTFPEHDALDLHRLVLAPGAGADGELRAEEIRRLNLRQAQLVVLSVCNGGIYRFGPGGELHGLVAAFLSAGVRNLLATLWAIDDAVGRRFVVSFYRRLLEAGPAQALRCSMADSRASGAPISHWAAFVMIGDGRPLSPPASSWPASTT